MPDGGGIAHAKPPRVSPFWQAASGPFMTFSGEGARAGFTAVTLLCDDLSSHKAPSSAHSWAGMGTVTSSEVAARAVGEAGCKLTPGQPLEAPDAGQAGRG